MRKLNVLLVDDNAAFTRAARNFLQGQPNLQVVDTASSGAQAIDKAAALEPDLVLMDLVMPEMDGFMATRRIKQQPRAPKVIILTLHDSPAYRAGASRAGADGLIAKDDLAMELPALVSSLFPEQHQPTSAG